MAYTKIHAIKKTLSTALDYIENPEKTEDQLLVSGYNVDPLTASIEFALTENLAKEVKGNYKKTGGSNNLAYHMIQSFSPEDHVTPEEAHEIGKKLADEFLDGKYEYVIATHIDKGHIHNHIIFNSVSFYDLKKMNTQPYKTAAKIRAISDRLCTEHELSVIQGKQHLSYSYKEYLERKKDTSWKSEIRKRLNFVLDTVTDYEEFKAAANELGVTVADAGKHIKYQYIEQERWARGYKLSDNDQYTKESILQQLEKNEYNQALLKNAIRELSQQAQDYDHFKKLLKEQFSITTKKTRSGILSYHFDDIDRSIIKERALGGAFTTEAIIKAINKKEFDFPDPETQESVADEFNKSVKTKVEENDTRILLTDENIERVTLDGILINVPDGEDGKVFIENSHVNFLEDSQQYEIYIGSDFNYYFTSKNLDPDVPESEQLSSRYIKGENLIRVLETVNGIEPVEVEVGEADIKAISPKGMVISLPDLGLDSIFIENEFISYSRLNGGDCKVKIYENWTYNFRSAQNGKDKGNELKHIKGRSLIEALSGREISNNSLERKIAAMERRCTLADAKLLAETLKLIRAESINEVNDFDSKITELQSKVREVKETIKTLEGKNEQYKAAAKYLLAYNQYLPIKQEAAQQSPSKRKKFEIKYDSEIKAFDFAVAQLEKMGVNTNVDPEKVIALTKTQTEKVSELNKSMKTINEKIDSFRNAHNIVKTLQNEPKKEKRRQQEPEKDAR